MGKTPYRPGTVQSDDSSVTKGTTQDVEPTIGSNHSGGSAVPTIRTGQLQRQPSIPSSQTQFKSLALKMLCTSLKSLTLCLHSHRDR